MRRPLTLLLLCAILFGCGEKPRPSVVEPEVVPALPTFAIRNASERDSLARGPSITPEEAKAWSEALADTTKGLLKPSSAPVVLGRMKTGSGSVCLLLRERHLTDDNGTVNEVLLVEVPGNGRKVVGRSLAGYGKSNLWNGICSVEWQAPILRVRDQTQWITTPDSLQQIHIAQRSLLIELRIADSVEVLHQDTTIFLRDLDESGHIIPRIKRRIQ